jgi:hypothetical protein
MDWETLLGAWSQIQKLYLVRIYTWKCLEIYVLSKNAWNRRRIQKKFSSKVFHVPVWDLPFLPSCLSWIVLISQVLYYFLITDPSSIYINYCTSIFGSREVTQTAAKCHGILWNITFIMQRFFDFFKVLYEKDNRILIIGFTFYIFIYLYITCC